MSSSIYSNSSECNLLFEKIEEVKRSYQEKQLLITRIENDRKQSLNNTNLSIDSSKFLHAINSQSTQPLQPKPTSSNSKPQSFLSDLNDSAIESLRISLSTKDQNFPEKCKISVDPKSLLNKEFAVSKRKLKNPEKESVPISKPLKSDKEIVSEHSKRNSERSVVTVMNEKGSMQFTDSKGSGKGSKVLSRRSSESMMEKKSGFNREDAKNSKKDSEMQSENRILSLVTSSINVFPSRAVLEIKQSEKKEQKDWIKKDNQEKKHEKKILMHGMLQNGKLEKDRWKNPSEVWENGKSGEVRWGKPLVQYKFNASYQKSYCELSKNIGGSILKSLSIDKGQIWDPAGLKHLEEPPKSKLQYQFYHKKHQEPSTIHKHQRKKSVLLEIGLKGAQPLAHYFKKYREITISHIESRQNQRPRFKHTEKSKSDLIEIRKKLLNCNLSKNAPSLSKEDPVKPQKEPNPSLLLRLAQGLKHKLTKEEILSLSKRNYNQLPEVKKLKEDHKTRENKYYLLQKAKNFSKNLPMPNNS